MSAQQNYNVPKIRQADNLDENRVVLYKNSKLLGNGYYLVEISTNDTHLFIAAFDVESEESLLIELEQSKAQSILQEFQQDYELMASSLQVMNKRLVLLNPVSIVKPIQNLDLTFSMLFVQKFLEKRRLNSANTDNRLNQMQQQQPQMQAADQVDDAGDQDAQNMPLQVDNNLQNQQQQLDD